ncbi:acyltransferase [Ensifer canadensis]
MASHRNPPLPPQTQQPKTDGANSKLDKIWGKVNGFANCPTRLGSISTGPRYFVQVEICHPLADRLRVCLITLMQNIEPLIVDHSRNNISIADGVIVSGRIHGTGNFVRIGAGDPKTSLILHITGNDNVVTIDTGHCIRGLRLTIGSHARANKCGVRVGRAFSCEPDCFFEILNDAATVDIGDSCMFSRDIKIHYGDKPHLIFDKNTGAYRDIDGGINIGAHCWIGERVYMTKRAALAPESVAAACSVITKPFAEPHSLVGGNPARLLRSDITWIRNRAQLPKESNFEQSIVQYDASLKDKAGPSHE